jgi:chromosome segregation ATPase
MLGLKHYLMGGLALVAVTTAVAWYRGQLAEARLEGQLAEAIADVERAHGIRDSVEALLVPLVDSLTAERDTLQRKQAELEDNLRIAHRSARAWRLRYDEVRTDTSATMEDILEVADSTINELAEEAQECSLALKGCTAITQNLEAENEALDQRLTATATVGGGRRGDGGHLTGARVRALIDGGSVGRR